MCEPSADANTLFPHLCRLTPLQAEALALRLRGQSITNIARTLHVARMTVSRWCNHHPAFIAELNARQQELLAESTIGYRRLLRKSFKALTSAMDGESSDSIRVALSIVNGPTARKALAADIGPTTPVAVINQMALDEQKVWETEGGYMEPEVHNQFATRLAQLDFTPQPEPKEPNPTT